MSGSYEGTEYDCVVCGGNLGQKTGTVIRNKDGEVESYEVDEIECYACGSWAHKYHADRTTIDVRTVWFCHSPSCQQQKRKELQ